MLRRPATVLSLTPEDIADYEDRAAERLRVAELEARQQVAEARARTRHDTSSTAAALRRAALAATPTAGPSTGRYNSTNNGGGIDFHGTRVLTSPAEHQFSDEEQSDDSEAETSYYARAQSQAARVSFGRGQVFGAAHLSHPHDDEEDEEEELDAELEDMSEGPNRPTTTTSPHPRNPHPHPRPQLHPRRNILPTTATATATTDAGYAGAGCGGFGGDAGAGRGWSNNRA
ncbi:predicted protein [Chaetomium globosum CBS 148.51]|uniref:Anaphase-promoting complex subunit CDC26 n=1 Tax=Chaetomium globosum (strain ATCC 6205 / CBS 148.51 / DSM 1962 / NBRC 6347 / NRRL 1970) TaxID=306901 RepID=Q2HFJ3_CHAGB|nr:uncharacterized protein CHGG_01011 [Chaetomium globosum CBS 148.51]EAQ92776.1 predicted protein [Chaetomium globosum CBS 148.51]